MTNSEICLRPLFLLYILSTHTRTFIGLPCDQLTEEEKPQAWCTESSACPPCTHPLKADSCSTESLSEAASIFGGEGKLPRGQNLERCTRLFICLAGEAARRKETVPDHGLAR